MFGIGMPEMIVILVIALVVIGPAKLPEIARSIGRGYAEFSKSMRSVQRDFNTMTAELEEEKDIIKNPMKTLGKVVEDSFGEEEEQKKEPSADTQDKTT